MRKIGRLGGLRTHALHDSRVTSAPGLAAARTALDKRLLAEVDPNGVLAPDERAKRLARARKAHFLALGLKAAAARRAKGAAK